MKYLITYELNNKTKDYSELYTAIKQNGPWWHYLGSTWIVNSERTANQITDSLLPYIDGSVDYLLVIGVDTTSENGWLPKEAWDWLKT